MANVLQRSWTHLWHGTFLERLSEHQQARQQRRRAKIWDDRAQHGAYLTTLLDGGLRMRLHFDSVLARAIYCQGFELQERRFLRAFLRPGDSFVDIGANIGLFTLIAAHAMRGRGSVYAFEPGEVAYRRLRDNVELNGFQNVRCYRTAISDQEQLAALTVSLNGWDAWSSLSKPIVGARFATEEVACTTWEQFATQHGLVGKVTMIKIDVEGWESHVLKGGRASFSRPDAPTLQVEFTEAAAAAAGTSCAALYRQLIDFGYRMFSYDAARSSLKPEPPREHYPYTNLLATKQPEQVVARLRGRR